MCDIANKLYLGDSREVLKTFPDKTIQCVVTSPEYYGNSRWHHGTLDDFLALQKSVFEQVFRSLKEDGVVFVNINDVFIKDRGYLNVPGLLDLELRKLGFVAPQKPIMWERDTALPNATRLQDLYEYVFVYSKNLTPKFNKEALRTPAKYTSDRRPDKTGLATKDMPNLWKINKVFSDGRQNVKAHSCPFPYKLVENCLLLATVPGDLVLDPYAGSGTTCYVTKGMGRKYVGVEINEDYYKDALRNIESGTSVYKYEPGLFLAQQKLF